MRRYFCSFAIQRCNWSSLLLQTLKAVSSINYVIHTSVLVNRYAQPSVTIKTLSQVIFQGGENQRCTS
jgi:hypothetical protein